MTAADDLYAVVLAGGSGTRFWPLSRRQRPKQFLAIGTPRTLIEETVRRLCPLIPADRVLIVAGESHAAQVRALLPGARLLSEPCARNTAPCVGLAALHLLRRDPRAILAVLPSDHHIADAAGFRRLVVAAAERAAAGEIVTIGIRPDRPETGYGYIHFDRDTSLVAGNGVQICQVRRFVEKPPRAVAERYLAEGGYLWNSGMFFFTARRILDDIERYLPALHAALLRIDSALGLPDERETVAREFNEIESISLDYGIMEHAREVRVIPGDIGWNDVGHWAALADFGGADTEGNVVADGAARPVLIDAHRNIVQPGDRLVALIGVSNLVVIDTPDALLICDRERVQEVRRVVQHLQDSGREDLL